MDEKKLTQQSETFNRNRPFDLCCVVFFLFASHRDFSRFDPQKGCQVRKKISNYKELLATGELHPPRRPQPNNKTFKNFF